MIVVTVVAIKINNGRNFDPLPLPALSSTTLPLFAHFLRDEKLLIGQKNFANFKVECCNKSTLNFQF